MNKVEAFKSSDGNNGPLPLPCISIDAAGRIFSQNVWAEHWVRNAETAPLFDSIFRDPRWNFEKLKTYLKLTAEHRLLYLPLPLRTDSKHVEKLLCFFNWEQKTDNITCVFVPRLPQLINSIREIEKSVALKTTLVELLSTSTKHARLLVDADRAYIKLHDKTSDLLRFEALSSVNPQDKFPSDRTTSSSRGMTGYVFTRREPYNSGDVRVEPPERYYQSIFSDTVSKIVIPLLAIHHNECLGVLAVDSKKLNYFSEDDQELLVTLATFLSVALEQLRKYEELNLTFHQLIKEHNKQQNTITYALMHDAKNMLRSVVYLLQEIQKELGYTNLQKRRAHDLQQQIDRLDKVKDMMGTMLDDMKQADSDSYIEEEHEVDLVPLIQNAVNIIPLGTSEIEIDVQALIEPCLVFGTHSQLLPVFYNLVINSVNAISKSGRPGEITITLSDAPQREGFRRIKISDNGPGLPKQILAFVRKGEEFSGTPGGTGLGLRTVRTTVSGLGGSIDVSSNMGEGTTFTLDLKGPRQQ